MGVGEIIFLIFLLALVGFIIVGGIVCVVGFEILVKRYEKFYLTTDLGRELHKLLHTIDKLDNDIDWCNRKLKSTRDRLDEIHRYYPKNEYFRKIGDTLRLEYFVCKRELNSKRALMSDCEVKLQSIKKQLPKGCKNILQYDWRNIEGEKE